MKKLILLFCVLAGFNNLAAMHADAKDSDAKVSTGEVKAAKKSDTDRLWVHTVLELTRTMAEVADKKAFSIEEAVRPGADEQTVIHNILMQSMRAAHQHVTAFQEAMDKISDTDLVAKIRAAHAKARTDHVMASQIKLKAFDSAKAAVAAVKAFGKQAVEETEKLVKQFDVQFETVIVSVGKSDIAQDFAVMKLDAGDEAW